MSTNVQLQQRIASLDVMRGFALLGILLMNIQSFAMPGATYLNPFAYGDMTGMNSAVWHLSHIFADQKFMTLFSLLFGAGVLVFSERLETKGMASTGLHYRRMTWLLIFGLLHGYLFWYGDILFSYAMCGFIVYLLRRKTVKTLFTLGFVFISISFFINYLTGASLAHLPAEALSGINESWKPAQEHINKEIHAYTGSWMSALEYRAEETFFMQTYVFLTTFLWRAGGVMLLGMALYKMEFFGQKWPTAFYIKTGTASLFVGLALIAYGLTQNHANQFSLQYSMFIGSQFNYWGSLF